MATTTKSKSGNRSSVMTFRASPSERVLIAKAAQAKKFDESAYVRKSVMTQVEMDLADRTEFQISAKDMQAFLTALDQPVQNKPRLRKLLNEKSILD